jgi:hypothetical protein
MGNCYPCPWNITINFQKIVANKIAYQLSPELGPCKESSLPNEIINLFLRSGDVITVLSTGPGIEHGARNHTAGRASAGTSEPAALTANARNAYSIKYRALQLFLTLLSRPTVWYPTAGGSLLASGCL